MALDYHLTIFLILFFACLGAAIVLVIPLAVVLIMGLAKEDGVRLFCSIFPNRYQFRSCPSVC
jgi:hypothetical protein